MPAQGKHRRPKSHRLGRAAAVAAVGGAAVALPLISAGGAQAATAQTYTVKAGDTLTKIAKAEKVDGGWQKLYAANKTAIGSDAGLIQPGLKISLGTAAAGAQQASATTTAAYVKPVDAGIGTPYHQNGSMWSSGYHTGTDFVVPTGTPIKAIAAGTVVSAGDGGAYGNQVVIRHADGHYSQYAHLSQLGVTAGQAVSAGTQIGLSGATGNVTGPHLHFEIRTTPDYGSDLDPVAYLTQHGVTF
jgi:murein DD-endopeptidase MepM/ murein hydrolase activator NlpD